VEGPVLEFGPPNSGWDRQERLAVLEVESFPARLGEEIESWEESFLEAGMEVRLADLAVERRQPGVGKAGRVNRDPLGEGPCRGLEVERQAFRTEVVAFLLHGQPCHHSSRVEG